MGKYKKLVGNSFIFAVGNLGSKFISFLLLPLYTYTLTTSAYGTADLIQTTINLLLPIISLNVFDGVLRFAMDKNESKSEVFTTGFQLTIIGSAISLFLGVTFQVFWGHNAFLLVLILLVQAFQSLFSQYLKAIGNVKLFAVNGILLSVVTALLDVMLLWVFHLGLFGFLIVLIIANVVSDWFLWKRGKLSEVLRIRTVSREMVQRLIGYSAPLIPNTIAWWTTSTISRYFIAFFVGASGNGLFAVANRIPSLLNVFNTIFFQSWQLSAIEEFGSEQSSKFYSNVFKYYSQVMFFGTSGILLILKPIMRIIVSPNFYTAWKFVPLLLVSVVFSSFSSFYGQYYIAAKRTTGVLVTTVVGAAVNIGLNFVLIPRFGLLGASVSAATSYIILWILRLFQTQKIIRTTLDMPVLIGNLVVIVAQIFALYHWTDISGVLLQIPLVLISLIVNFRTVIDMLRKRRAK